MPIKSLLMTAGVILISIYRRVIYQHNQQEVMLAAKLWSTATMTLESVKLPNC